MDKPGSRVSERRSTKKVGYFTGLSEKGDKRVQAYYVYRTQEVKRTYNNRFSNMN